MTKIWRCTQCEQTVTKGLIQSLSDEPSECPACGNEELSVTGVTGGLHQFIDDPKSTLSSRRTRRRFILTGAGGAAVVGGSWWIFGRPQIEQTTEVSLQDSQFHPRNIEISVGDEVTWTNEEETESDVENIVYNIENASDNWEFEAELDEGQDATYTFEEPGIYDVYDLVFGDEDLSGMSMRIGVDEEVDDPLGGWF